VVCAQPFLWTALGVNLVALVLAGALLWRVRHAPAARAAAHPAGEAHRLAA